MVVIADQMLKAAALAGGLLVVLRLYFSRKGLTYRCFKPLHVLGYRFLLPVNL